MGRVGIFDYIEVFSTRGRYRINLGCVNVRTEFVYGRRLVQFELWVGHMATPRFTPKFKDEAVRQITQYGYCVTEVYEQSGFSAHSRYK